MCGGDLRMSWNVLDPDGQPYESLGVGVELDEGSGLVLALMTAWIEAVASPADPLSQPSASMPSSV